MCVSVCVWLTFLLARAEGSPASCEAMSWEVGPREKSSSLTSSCERSSSIAEAKDYRETGGGKEIRPKALFPECPSHTPTTATLTLMVICSWRVSIPNST